MENKPCRRVFTETLLELALSDPSIVALANDSIGSVTLGEFVERLPEQYIEVGIAEQNMVGIGAGMALAGMKPFVCAPACFLSMRSAEQVKVDVAYSEANVKLIGVSGGVSYGALGSTLHSVQDLALMRAIPGMTVILPCDNRQTRAITRQLVAYDGPVYMRVGRGAVEDVYLEERDFAIGKAVTLLDGHDLTIIAAGETVSIALKAGKELQTLGYAARVLDMHTIKPIDREAIVTAARETKGIITIEEHSVHGGLGAAVAEITAVECPVRQRIIGIPDEPAVHGSSAEIFRHYGLTVNNLVANALELLQLSLRG